MSVDMGKKNTVSMICVCVFVVLVGIAQAENNERRDVTKDKQIPHSLKGVADIEKNRNVLPRSNRIYAMCPTPKRPENGYIYGELIGVGAVMEVRCNNGYTLDGPAKMTCVQGKDGAFWSPDVSRSCLVANSSQSSLRSAPLDTPQETEQGKSHAILGEQNVQRGIYAMCPTPKRPENGYIYGELIGVGRVIEVRCNNGYTLDGPAKMTCVAGKDGPFWSPDVPRSCVASSSQQSLKSATLDTPQETEQRKKNTILKKQNVKRDPKEPASSHIQTLPARCLYEPEAGSCGAYIKRYYFKDTNMECHTFFYGGCEGNANNFLTMDECNEACRGHK